MVNADPTTKTPRRAPRLRALLAALVGAVAVAAACGGSTDADPETYFGELEQSQAELDARMDAFFDSPAALAVEDLVGDGELATELSAQEEQEVKQFVEAFWTGVVDAAEAHRDEVDDLVVPDEVRAAHDDYVEALSLFLSERDDRQARIDSSGAVDLLPSIWEGSPGIDAVDRACLQLDARAVELGIAFVPQVCADG